MNHFHATEKNMSSPLTLSHSKEHDGRCSKASAGFFPLHSLSLIEAHVVVFGKLRWKGGNGHVGRIFGRRLHRGTVDPKCLTDPLGVW